MIDKYCLDCKKSISERALRCRSCASIERWRDSKHRILIKKVIKKTWKNPNRKKIAIKKAKEQWKDPSHRILISQKAKIKYLNPQEHVKTGLALRKKWKDPEFRAKHCGENNHFYIHGRNEYPYGLGWTELLKQEIRDRDSHLCRNCKKKENGRAHDVHHIDFDKINNDPINLITLCKRCHDATKPKYNRKKWINYFQKLQIEMMEA